MLSADETLLLLECRRKGNMKVSENENLRAGRSGFLRQKHETGKLELQLLNLT